MMSKNVLGKKTPRDLICKLHRHPVRKKMLSIQSMNALDLRIFDVKNVAYRMNNSKKGERREKNRLSVSIEIIYLVPLTPSTLLFH